jgi:hypothetical protein
MSSGYVYILVNPAYRDHLIKIGLTTREPEERAKELSRKTSVPNEFVVAYKKHVHDCSAVEKIVHKYLDQYRTNERREFFQLPVEKAISVIERISKFENSLENWNNKIINLDNKTIKWHLNSDEFLLFFSFPTALSDTAELVDFWHSKDDGDEVFLVGDSDVNGEELKSNGFLSDEALLNPGDYIVWCGKDRNHVNKEAPEFTSCVAKITEFSKIIGFCSIPRIMNQGFPIQLATPGSGADLIYAQYACKKVKKIGPPRVWARENL